MGQYLIAMIVGVRLLGDDLVGGGDDAVGSGGDGGVDSLEDFLGFLHGLFDSGLSLGSLLGIVVSAGGDSDHHGDDGIEKQIALVLHFVR